MSTRWMTRAGARCTRYVPLALSAHNLLNQEQACATGTRKVVRTLLDAGADIELALPNGDRPLHVALINENEELALLLLDRGADIYAFASRNRSPLHIAADYNLPSAVLELLDRGLTTQIDHIDESTWTPLCCCGHVDIVEILLEHGANVHYADRDGWTPLHQAVHNGEGDVALALIAAGAKLDGRTRDDGQSVLERAVDLAEWQDATRERPIEVEVLLKAAAQRESRIMWEGKLGYLGRKRTEEEEWRRVKEEEKRVEEERKREEERRRRKEEEESKKKEQEQELEGLDGAFELVELED